MQEQPEGAELLDAVITLLRDQVVPALEGRLAFDVRVAARAASIVKRELELGPGLEAQARERLRALLELDSDNLEELNTVLCERLERGELGLQSPGLTEHLWQATLHQLAIDQPRYPGYMKALKQLQEQGENPGTPSERKGQ
ncbi:MAG: hypothetical protein JJT90_17665 [Ectothiorhodospiraceae bacterium]|nr:hypothetical protein [Ectothiorhodospiraceae bacterium]